MSDYASIIKKVSCGFASQTLHNKKPAAVHVTAIVAILLGSWSASYAQAEGDQFDNSAQIKLMISGSPKEVLMMDNSLSSPRQQNSAPEQQEKKDGNESLEKRLYDMVGDAPIREMVPFIAQRDSRVAAFLVGIAKKESSFGFASPSKDGITCYNYWGYKGSAGRGTGMGYACFASAEEAVQVVGDRLGVLVEKKRDTPLRMVDTWKCGVSCEGDPGAPGWVSTVALYFDKIVNQNV